MSITHKLLVDFNGQKYSVLVESDYKLLTFKTILNQIKQQIDENITFDDYLFELFDKDFEEYVIISTQNHAIDNLSRIRIKYKERVRQSDDNKPKSESIASSDTSCSPKKISTEMNSERDAFIQRLFSPNKKSENVKSDADRSFYSVVSEETNDLMSSDDLKSDSESYWEERSLYNHLIYANILPEPEVESHSQRPSAAARQPVGRFGGLNGDLMFPNRSSFADNLSDDLSNLELKKVSEQIMANTCSPMTSVGAQPFIKPLIKPDIKPEIKPINYLELEPSDDFRLSPSCPYLHYKTIVQNFRGQYLFVIRILIGDYKGVQKLLDLMFVNRNCFANNPSDEPSNVKWKTVSDQMMANGFNDWRPQKCRRGFKCALDLYKKTLSKCPDFEIAYKINPLFSDFHSIDLKYLIPLSELNEIRDLRKSFDRKPISSLNKTAINSKKFPSNQSLNVGNGSLLRKDRFSSTTSLSGAKEKDHLVKMNRVAAKLDSRSIQEIKTLLASAQAVAAQYGHVLEVNHFWTLVSNQMKAKGYVWHWNACQAKFTEHVCDYYSLAMIYSSDETSAQQMYPLFSLIHSMDLSQLLTQWSFDKISQTRSEFSQRQQ